MPTLDTVLLLLQHYGYFFLLPIAIIEGPIITVIAAFLASQGVFNIFIVFAVVVLGDLIGDLLFYGLGRWGQGSIHRWGPYIGVTEDRLQTVEGLFREKGGRTLIFGKVTHSAGFIILMAAGAVRMPIGEFLWYNLLGTIPKSLVFATLGYFVGYAYQQVDSYLQKGSIILFGLLLLGFAVAMYRANQRKNQA